MNRRDFHRWGALALGNLMGLALAVPGVAYLVDPLRRKSREGDFHTLTYLNDLTVGEPRAFPILDERQDAWVKYPREPVGSVWLIRQGDDSVRAFTAECPHLGCAIDLATDRKSFLCPCHTSAFALNGERTNDIPPRGMDPLDVEVAAEGNRPVRVKFQRFQTQTKERKPLV